MKLVLKPEELPADLIVIPAVFRIGKHAQDGHRTDKLKKLTFFNSLEHFGLLCQCKFRKGLRLSEPLSHLLQQILEPTEKLLSIICGESCQRSVDEHDDSRFTSTRCVVSRNDLRRDRLDFSCLFGRKE